ncbi:MAG: hypothetical protein IT514_10730 [Burkholderiales bacterium]|nr:hypothetical protein [Burkholderiales bacterium]
MTIPPRASRVLPPDVNPQTLSRLPPVRREALSDDDKAAYDALARPREGGLNLAGLQGPGGVWLRMPGLRRHIGGLNRYLRGEAGIDPRWVEIAILATAREMDSQIEWAMHEPVARDKGIPAGTIDAIRHRGPLAGVEPSEAAIVALAREAIGDHKVSAQTYARALDAFGEPGLLNIVALIASYASTAITLCVFDQQLHDGQEPLLPGR